MGTQRKEGRTTDKLSVLVVDENLSHANISSYLLTKLGFKAMVYTSPVQALMFLKDHEKDIDFALVAVDMKEMNGFHFLATSRESHKSLQVIMMSADTTWTTMKRSVELGACFLVEKPVDANTTNSLWQHLDQKNLRLEKIKDVFQGIRGKGNVLRSEKKFGESTNKQKASQLMWTPFLQEKFLEAIEILGGAATPKRIQLQMDVKSIDRKQISAHLQKHREKVEKELRNKNAKKCMNGAKIRALLLGSVLDQSQHPNDPSGEKENKRKVDMIGDGNCGNDWTYRSGDENVVFETNYVDNAEGAMNNGQVSNGDAQAGHVKLVSYSDSEDGEAL